MLIQATGNVGPIEMPIGPGDILNIWQDLFTVNNAGNVTYVGNDLVKGDIDRTGPAGAATDTLPSADDWCKALSGALTQLTPPNNALYGIEPNRSVVTQFPFNLGILPPKSCYLLTWRNGGGGTLTLQAAANSGVTISGTATIATVVWREYFVQILNSTPTCVIPVTTTNANAVLTNVDANLIQQVTTGMSAYGTNIAASAVVLAVNRDAGTVTLSGNSTGTGNNIAVTFTPTITLKNRRAGGGL